ncbi:MAG: hypothetical protein ACF8SC_10245 [Phycisphaerales bacterium JB037]
MRARHPAAPRPGHHARPIRRATLAALALLLPSCADPAPPAPAPAPTNPIEAVTRGPALDVRLLAVPDDPARIARALAPYDDPRQTMLAERAALWRDNGLRVLAVPESELDPLLAAMSPRAASESRQIRPAAVWTPAAEGPSLPTTLFQLDAGTLRLPRGSVRLLARPWLDPVIETAAGAPTRPAADLRLRIDLLLQHVADDPLDAQRRMLQPGRIGPLDDGQVFDRLRTELAIPRGMAIVLISERVETDWPALVALSDDERNAQSEAEPADPSPDQPDSDIDSSESPATDKQAPPSDEPVFGPSQARVPTLGEALLGPTGYASRSSRLVLVFVPRLGAGAAP